MCIHTHTFLTVAAQGPSSCGLVHHEPMMPTSDWQLGEIPTENYLKFLWRSKPTLPACCGVRLDTHHQSLAQEVNTTQKDFTEFCQILVEMNPTIPKMLLPNPKY